MTGLRRNTVMVIGLLLSAGALYLVVRSIDIGEALGIISRANPIPLLVILGIVAIQVAVRAARWSILLPRQPSGRRSSVRRLAPALLIGYLGNAVLPARLGEPMRALIASRREQVGMTESLASVLLERAIDVATLALVAFVASLFVDAPTWARQALGVAAVVGVIGIGVLVTIGIDPVLRLANRLGLGRLARLSALAERFASSVGGPSRRPAILSAAAISLGAWLVDAVSFWLAGLSVGVDLPYSAALLVAGITVLGTAIPSAPGYVGTFELAAAGMAGALGVEPAPALAMAVVAHLMTLMPVAIGGAISLALVGTNLGAVADAADAQRGA